MGDTAIEWTDKTWNPVTGCDKVSPGCDHCYAESIAHRFAGTKPFPNGFAVTLHPERLTQPFRWRKPAKVFVNSMSDLFHKDIPDEYIAQVWAVMLLSPKHTFQVLTKRHARMKSLLRSDHFPRLVRDARDRLLKLPTSDGYARYEIPRNVWLGVSVENQQWADIRIPVLLDTPAARRFISAEPLLGPIDLDNCGGYQAVTPEPDRTLTYLNWVIVGGESGAKAREMYPNWVYDIRDQCNAAGVPFLFKQWGGRTPKANGRVLDGRTWDEYPREA
jgi:protein gp37